MPDTAVSVTEVPAVLIRAGDVLAYQGRELLVTGTHGTWYHEADHPIAGLAIECRTGSARWILYRRASEVLSRMSPG